MDDRTFDEYKKSEDWSKDDINGINWTNNLYDGDTNPNLMAERFDDYFFEKYEMDYQSYQDCLRAIENDID